MSTTAQPVDAPTRLVRLGRDFTLIQMSAAERSDALQAAYWRTCSPHEWVWSPNQQAAMALYCLWAAQRLEMLADIATGKVIQRETSADEDA